MNTLKIFNFAVGAGGSRPHTSSFLLAVRPVRLVVSPCLGLAILLRAGHRNCAELPKQ